MNNSFEFPSAKLVHHTPFLRFTDAGNANFVDSNLYSALNRTPLFDMSTGRTDICDVTNHGGLRFQKLKGDYDYLTRWYHNPHKGANTRHGSYIMLYWIDNEADYFWKLSQSLFTKVLTFSDDLTELFDFG